MTTDLLPCPFCGNTPPPPVDATRILGVWRVIHKRCTVLPNFSVDRSEKAEAIAAWNRRADLTPSPEVVKELVEALRTALRFIENTESELGIKLDSGERARAVLAKLEGRA